MEAERVIFARTDILIILFAHVRYNFFNDFIICLYIYLKNIYMYTISVQQKSEFIFCQ